MSVTLDEDEEVPGLGPDGRPDPAYAESLGLRAAGLGRRAGAFALDVAILLVLLLPIYVGALPIGLGILADRADPSRWVSHPDFLVALILWIVGQGLATIYLVVQLVLHGLKGVTVGKAIVGIRSVNVATFGKPGFWRIVLRALVFSAAFTIIPYLGAIPFLLSPLWDPQHRGRGWLDRIGNNWLIDARRGLDPFDSKAFRQARRALTAPRLVEGEALPSLATGTAWGGPTFVPSARSSSGVVAPALEEEAGPAWEPPPVGLTPSDARPPTAQVGAPPAPVQPPAPAAQSPAPPPVAPAAQSPAPAVAPPAQPAAPAAAARAAELVFDDGLRLEVRGPGLLGRSPEAAPGEAVEHLYRIEDAARQLSKTHLAFGIDEAGVWIADRGSSNGTFVRTESGAILALEAGKRTWLAPGHVVEIGDKTFTVRTAP